MGPLVQTREQNSEITSNAPISKICEDHLRLTVWYTNADTLTKEKFNELNLRMYISKPDLVCIVEVNPKNSIFDTPDEAFNIQGYNLNRNISGRGIIIYSAIHLTVSDIEIISNFEEQLCINIKVNKKENLILGGIYRSPNSNLDNNLKLSLLLDKITGTKHNHLLLTGDFNMKEINWNSLEVNASANHFAHVLFDTVNNNFLSEVVKQPTRQRGSDNPSALDWVLTENESNIENLYLESPLGSSDHAMICFDYVCPLEKTHPTNEPRYAFFKGDYESIKQGLNLNWSEQLCTMDTQHMWNKISNTISGLIEKHIPKKKFSTSSKPPWLNRELKNLINRKNKAWKKHKNHPNGETKAIYSQLKQNCNIHINKAKNEYENSIANDIKVNPKRFWKYVNSKVKTKSKISELTNKNNETVSDDYGKAQALNEQFASVFTVEDGNLPPLPVLPDNEILCNIQFTVEEIKKRLTKINISKAAGPDGIPGRVLVESAEELSPALKILFDKSISEGKLPVEWKHANIVALFKKGSKKLPVNYRPVSLTSICCKFFEKFVRDSVIKFLEGQGIINKNQHGFRNGRSCCTQLLEIMEIWTKWFDQGLPWDVIYTDFSKAFDTVPHNRLMYKLDRLGIRGDLYNWIKDFLSDRQQRVMVGDSKSEWLPVTSGIPQGSVLGPVLFVIFINDMPDVVNANIKLFADDTKIFKAVQNLENIENLQEDINKMYKWSLDWQLPFNVNKCKVVHFGKNNINHSYKMNRQDLIMENEEKDLGVTFDPKLNFNAHINNTFLTLKMTYLMSYVS